MNNMQVIIWLFPILFIFHDFEEIIFMQVWISRNKLYLRDRFPALLKKLLPHFENITTSSFACGVAEEFIIISIITVVSYIMNWYNLWIGLFIAFILHLLIHCFQALILRKYVPAIVTSVICLPVCLYIIKPIIQVSMLSIIILYSIFGLIIMVMNLCAIHKYMDVFNKWSTSYGHQIQ
ncbi:MAG: HXXEE domain-containing protein [Clostridiaceae bacterium]